jgi:hypothetical protein
MVQDDPKLPDDSEEVSKPNGMVGGLIPNREIFSLLDQKKQKWSSTYYVPKYTYIYEYLDE